MSAQDPFYAVRDSLEAAVQELRVKFGDWKLLLGASDTYLDVKFKQKHEEVTRDLKKCSEMVARVRMAVEKTEKNRTQFSHVDDRELGQRKAFVDRVDGVRFIGRAEGAEEGRGVLPLFPRKAEAAKALCCPPPPQFPPLRPHARPRTPPTRPPPTHTPTPPSRLRRR